ncbi:MAG: hypothetical protein ACD_62C00428G0007, partial [uncultured bacterium]
PPSLVLTNYGVVRLLVQDDLWLKEYSNNREITIDLHSNFCS